MKLLLSTLIIILLLSAHTQAQQPGRQDSLVANISDSLVKVISENYSKKIYDSIFKSVKDSLHWQSLKSTAMYPVIKNSEWSAAFPVPQVTDKPDPSIKYKLMFNMTLWSKDTASRRQINEGLAEIGRIINLHVAAGVPIENLELVLIIHGPAMNVYFKNEEYLKKFKTNNPNLDILKQFTNLKAKLIACGQAELFFNIPPEKFIPEVKTAFSAKVAISTYQLKGYVLYNVEEEK